ncbi:ribonuclease III [Candidatus Uhrbacteria bacterium RIFCSPLOWO2_01_FULL_47_24]|uniref:Ribonuclease 3 n=1 Tax=Candidatus Uhrbacteria bacterium RIFCSPLOWO2_01_FULL_47_24 TaxID=1802401 RepID=A0A1F7UUR0_9BACT|nr:MAG: ribonuclease III [Candidatus Uhrbacteria bacterium RIFCSPHIGHO2_01_FULL_47_11]OGL69296.1 MAG: ribonuclease III [Candidatus Uhrbacteria bacterium RIFCSPHIGHO2_02_FULL_46_47]OGL76366.1 MAG: ribonuclease III [Candidatus Uhrbacteria bacterium RIFCSPHIGHO2_12_FULL_47_11]OGL82030.1 MAG: ribonuclease III [Candidatus Uhrbacteria bacterium RIFCSPLOWO2_01_FULL_47_24]OGL85424.1 MAG: ribonuclease III [Candidatus Uhrbacteria bacterium RIFCSPLOWO2_02_FULL_46_25]OGL92259.1 MAG: ribonuclease III [Cand
MKDWSKLEHTLGVTFKNQDLLKQALVHRSYLNENPAFHLPQNERLEFLGDAVLELAVTEHLYNHYPNPEGELTNWRAALVNAKMMAEIAKDIGLDDYLFLSRGEAKDTGSKARQIILANAIEAVIGAIYLDQGMEVATTFTKREVLTKLPHIIEYGLYVDAKSHFQELVQEKMAMTPSYRVLSEIGPDHAKQFKIGVYIGDIMIAEGFGTSKQEAQMSAAEAALKSKWEEKI